MRLLLGANEGIRTPDLLITNQLRYRLRHISKAYSVIKKCKSLSVFKKIIVESYHYLSYGTKSVL